MPAEVLPTAVPPAPRFDPARLESYKSGIAAKTAKKGDYVDAASRSQPARPLSTTECEAIKCDLAPTELGPFTALPKSTLISRNPDAESILYGDDMTYNN